LGAVRKFVEEGLTVREVASDLGISEDLIDN